MSFFAILCALLIEQVRPLAYHNPIYGAVLAWTRWTSRNFDAGHPHHGVVVWALAVGLPTLVALGVHALLLYFVGWVGVMLWTIAVLYVTLGFRQFSHHFTGIRDALELGDDALARQLLAHWQRVDVADLPGSAVVRHVIEFSVIAAHRHVFGVLAWFSIMAMLGLGPAGAVFYRMSEFVVRYWARKGQSAALPASPGVRDTAQAAWHAIDWLPARITALGFAVVGSFEDAIDCWRHHAARFPEANDGVILAATSGALNVSLGGSRLSPRNAPQTVDGFAAAGEALMGSPSSTTATATPGKAPTPAHLRSVVALVWRSVVMWLVLLALLTLARLLG